VERLLSSKVYWTISAPLGEDRWIGQSPDWKIDEQGTRPNENDKRLSEKIDDLNKRLDIVQTIALVEAKVRYQGRASKNFQAVDAELFLPIRAIHPAEFCL
jgi:hypothetical protein